MKEQINDILQRYDLGMANANEVIDFFLSAIDVQGKSNELQYMIEQKRDKLLRPLADKIAQFLEEL